MSTAGVLVVEDDAFTLSTLCAALRQHGVVVVGEASSAAQAILLANELQPSAALIDLDLGKGPTGIDLARPPIPARYPAGATGIVPTVHPVVQ